MAAALETSVVNNEHSWMEFCERHATAAAQDFSKSCAQFITLNLSEQAKATITHRDFLKRFIDTFTEQFEADFNRRRQQQQSGGKVANGSSRHDEDTSDNEDGSPKMHHKPFFRRLSFKMLRKGKDLFHKQHSDDVELGHSRTKLAKIVVECRKEGIVNYSTPESLDQPGGPPKWEKCRLALVKAVGGYMLEFYSPPKSTKPRSGVFCALITEARETTALEMPDHENTFVLKANNSLEFVIEAHDTDDMRSWLATIKYCIRSGAGHEGGGATGGLSGTGGATDRSLKDYHTDPPELPPRHASGRVGDRLSSSSNFDMCPSAGDGNISMETDIGQTLKKEFWFHGTLGRSEATNLVLHDGARGHGLFLVRQSETRTGEFVLTFNFQGRAKHLRMTINDQGQCRVQHYWFQSIYEMLEHFRQQPIPLESGGNSDVTLTDFVVNPNARSQSTTGRSTTNTTTTITSTTITTSNNLEHNNSQTTSNNLNQQNNTSSTTTNGGATIVQTTSASTTPTGNGGGTTVSNLIGTGAAGGGGGGTASINTSGGGGGGGGANGAGERRIQPLPEVRQVQTHNGSVRTQETTLEQISEARAVENQYSFV